MTTILGIVGSARRWGNSELLTRQGLLGAQTEGALVRAVRLTDLHLESCTGCMRCVLGGKPCPLDDDMPWLIDSIQAADGVILAAPTYFLGPAAVLKLVLDRLLMLAGRTDWGSSAPRPAVTLATAGLEGWRGVTLPYLNALAAVFGFRTIESLTGIAPGPGEVLLDEPLMADVLAAGQRLGRGALEPAPVSENVCPTCHCDAFVIRGDMVEPARAVCPICGRIAHLESEGNRVNLRFDLDMDCESVPHRWTPEGMRSHMVDWVMATGPRFMAHRREIKDRRRPYSQMQIEWLCPPSAETE